MKIISMIPARYSASRFPGKLMQDLGGKTVILRTYEAMVATNLFDDVIVVTDSKVIYDEIVNNGGKAMMSIKEHECGSDRIAEAVEFLDIDIVINVQGDEPFTDKESLLKLIEVFKDDHEKQIDLASLMGQITDLDEINNPNIVKTVISPKLQQIKFPILEIKKTDEVLEQLKNVFSNGISPSSLATYIYNPISFYEQKC